MSEERRIQATGPNDVLVCSKNGETILVPSRFLLMFVRGSGSTW